MARKSTKTNKNIYQTTRENLDLTREEASELLETVSPERIEKIENERSLPYPDEVLLMSDKYKQPPTIKRQPILQARLSIKNAFVKMPVLGTIWDS